jgi:hypothetical protein
MNNGIFGGIDFNEALSMPSQRQQQSMVAEVENAVTVYDPDHFKNWEEQTVQDITLEQLRKTNRELNGGLPMHGIHHFELIEQVMDIVKNAGLEPEIFDMFAAKAGGSQYPGVSLNKDISKTLTFDPQAELNVAAYTVRRIYTTIHINGFDDGESDQSLAIGYNQQGLEVALGRNVRICHNQTILGADRIIRTYSRGQGRLAEKITYRDVLDKVVEWMRDIHHLTFEDDQKIAQMKATVIPPAKIFMLIGMLDATRIACDTKYKEIRLNAVYPLNDGQIHKMTEQLLLRNAHNQQVTAWDFYSIANDMYKPQLMDTTQLFPQNEAMVQFIDQYVMAPAV